MRIWGVWANICCYSYILYIRGTYFIIMAQEDFHKICSSIPVPGLPHVSIFPQMVDLLIISLQGINLKKAKVQTCTFNRWSRQEMIRRRRPYFKRSDRDDAKCDQTQKNCPQSATTELPIEDESIWPQLTQMNQRSSKKTWDLKRPDQLNAKIWPIRKTTPTIYSGLHLVCTKAH